METETEGTEGWIRDGQKKQRIILLWKIPKCLRAHDLLSIKRICSP